MAVQLKNVVIGLGATGLSCVRYLKRRGASVSVADSRENPPGLSQLQQEFPDVSVHLGGFPEKLLNEADRLIVSPGVAISTPLIAKQAERGAEIIGDIELFSREAPHDVLAITGSNGKTTVTTLMGRIAENSGRHVSVCGNIGPQALDALSDQTVDAYVMELSSFQLETTHSLKTLSAVALNVTPDHMDRYPTFADYLAAKQRVYQACQYPVVNLDQPEIWQPLFEKKTVIGFTLQTPKENEFGLIREGGAYYLAEGLHKLMPCSEMKLQGEHHFQNALACLAMGQVSGFPREILLDVLKNFSGLAHRCELVAEKQGVRWINDSKGTNVGATVAAINTLATNYSGRMILIAGGDAKQADLSPLTLPIASAVSCVYLFGQDADAIAAVIEGHTAYEKVNSLAEAVSAAASLAKPGDCVLLSPACASLDMFKNYEHRGECFRELVKQL